MTKQELAKFLDGMEYGNELTREIEDTAQFYGLVIVHGASDDLMEFRGAISDEVGCTRGGIVPLLSKGPLPEPECDACESCELYQNMVKDLKTIEALWCAPDSPTWTYKTEIPHETFNIMEDGNVYCRGIVFCIDDLK